MRLNFRMNKKGDIPSILYVVAILFVAGIVLLLFSKLSLNIYDKLDEGLESVGYDNSTEAGIAIDSQISLESSNMWDYVFLSIAIAYTLSLFVLAYATQVNPVFYFVYGIVAAIGLFVAVALANGWEAIATNVQLSDTISRFPITNLLLDNYFPIFMTVVILSVMVMLFGKYVQGQSGGLG